MRLNAAARERGLSYSGLVAALKRANIALDRKQLSELAINDEGVFNQLVAMATGAKAA